MSQLVVHDPARRHEPRRGPLRDGRRLMVAFDVKTERSRPLSEAERNALEQYLAQVTTG